MSTERRTRPRWQVWLWATMMDAITGGTVVLAATFAVALIAAWVWAATEAPAPIPWVARAVAALIALVLLGRWVDSWDSRRPGVAGPPVVPMPLPMQLDTGDPHQCASYRAVRGHLLRCELKLHMLGDSVHQVSRPNGRWVWGAGVSAAHWLVDDHWAATDPAPPPEPFDWQEYNAARLPHKTLRRDDEPRP